MHLSNIQHKIYEIRSQKVLLDFDLAELYEVETKRLNEAVKRNKDRFPERFMFRLTQEEWKRMRSQISTASDQSKRNTRTTPFAFTEHGVTMLASILRSKKAIETNILIVDAFIALQKFALNYVELSTKLTEIEAAHNQQFKDVYDAINYLLQKDQQITKQEERKRIGFKEN